MRFPLLTHRRYCSLVLSHWNDLSWVAFTNKLWCYQSTLMLNARGLTLKHHKGLEHTTTLRCCSSSHYEVCVVSDLATKDMERRISQYKDEVLPARIILCLKYVPSQSETRLHCNAVSLAGRQWVHAWNDPCTSKEILTMKIKQSQDYLVFIMRMNPNTCIWKDHSILNRSWAIRLT